MYTLPGLELSRFRRNTIARLATVVIAFIPAIYGCLYLASNWDPTENLDQLDAAVVNLDTGAQLPDSPDGTPGEHLDAGDELTSELTTSDDAGFTWTEVDAKTAAAGLNDGTYAAVLHIPRGFSANIASSGKDHPQKAELTLETDDAHNYIVGTVAQQVLETIRGNLNETTTAKYVDQVYIGFNEIQAKMTEAADGAQKVSDGASDLHEGTGTLAEGTGTAREGAGELADGLGELSDGADRLADGTGRLATGASDLHDGTNRLREGSSEAADRSGDLADGARQVADGTEKLSTKADEVDAKAARVRDRVDEFDQKATPIISDSRQALSDAHDQTVGDLQTRADELASKYPDDPDVQALSQELETMATDLENAHSRADAAADDVESARRGVRDTVDSAADRIDEAAGQIHRLDEGATQVADGADRLHEGLVTLDDGVGQLDDGAAKLKTGASEVNDGAGRLAEASSTAAEGGRDLADGLVELDDGAHRLDEGAGELDEGAGELSDGIAEGADSVPTYSSADRDTRSDVVAVPVEGDAQRDHAVEAYGEGLAPFFLSLALWIGGMITYMVLNAIPYRALASSARSWRIAWSGYAPGMFFGVLQVLVIFTVLTFTLDFTVPSWLATIAFAILVAASFHAVHQLCVVLLGSLGRLVALILLMLQIGAAGGTYPVETTPPFFQAIAPFLPMTYAVEGLRGLIAGGNTLGVAHSAVMLLAFGVGALTLSAFVSSRKRVVTVARLYPSLEL